MKMKLILFVTALTVALILSGCSSLPEKITKLTQKADYQGAFEILEEEGLAGIDLPEINPEKKADKRKLEARKIFRESAENHFGEEREQLLFSGHAIKALRIIEEGARLCVWSEKLKQELEHSSTLVDKLNELQKKANELSRLESISVQSARSFLSQTAEVLSYLADHPTLGEIVNASTKNIALHWAARIDQQLLKAVGIDLKLFSNDIKISNIDPFERKRILSAIIYLNSLPKAGKLIIDQEKLAAFVQEVSEANIGSSYVVIYDDAFDKSFLQWCRTFMANAISAEDCSYEAISSAEKVRKVLPQLDEEKFNKALMKGHLNRANFLSNKGYASLMSLVHLGRFRELSKETPLESDKKVELIRKLAMATYNTTDHIRPKITVDVDPAVNFKWGELMWISTMNQIKKNTKSHFKWRWINPENPDPEVLVKIDSATYYSPSLDDLSSKTSTYHSGYQSVPNPRKKYLKSRLSSQEFTVDSSKRSYNSAVSWFNSYPTEYSLSSLNNARNRYNMAVNSYNSLVNQYNATPTTIQEPVFLPYTFQEGIIQHGWAIRGYVKVRKRETDFKSESIDDDFVRIGAKFKDRNPAYRRNDGIDIPLTGERGWSHLVKVQGDIINALRIQALNIKFEDKAGLTDDEKKIISNVIHPFGTSEETLNLSKVPFWSRETVQAISLPDVVGTPPPTKIIPSNADRVFQTGDSVKVAAYLRNVACQIKSGFQGSIRGSGVLISADGLILTCAHVLTGDKIQIVISDGPSKGTYEATPVFVNEQNDVAVLKAAGIKSKDWLSVSLDKKPVPTEEVVAIGNPSLGGKGFAKNAITKGNISTSETSKYGSERLVANITISSGSSGSPLISLKTGKIVGVVTAVLGPKLDKNKGFASSGFLCLAAPSTKLGEWLGLSE